MGWIGLQYNFYNLNHYNENNDNGKNKRKTFRFLKDYSTQYRLIYCNICICFIQLSSQFADLKTFWTNMLNISKVHEKYLFSYNNT